MKIVVFAGGSGTRFWPMSREKFPKQFKPLIGDKSTFEIHIENYINLVGLSNVLISTTELLSGTVKDLVPTLPLHNIIAEPCRRDVGPSVALVMLKLNKMGDGDEPTAITWSDAYIQNLDNYFAALRAGEEMLKENSKQLIFIGEEPKYPNENLGWIELGKKINTQGNITSYERNGFQYRPPLEKAKEWFEKKTHLWNTGYFMTTANFILAEYERQKPEMYQQLMKIKESLDTDKEYATIQEIYPQLESISFDNAILEGLDNSKTKVIGGDFKWADPGTLYALKQFLQTSPEENVTKGQVYDFKTKDSLIYNLVDGQLIATIGLDGFVVVNTPDALLICHKDQIPEIKNMVKSFENTELQKYL